MNHSLLAATRYFILLGAVSYLIFTAAMYFFQARLVFAPFGSYDRTPASMGLIYEDIVLKTPDGVTLRGWFVPAENARAVVLFCHGNAGNMSHRVETLELLHRMNLITFMFDYRGYGESGGSPTEKGVYTDAETAWKWLTEERGVPIDNLIIMGRSLGGPIASWLAAKHPPKALILESTFTSIVDMGKKRYPWLPVALLSRFRFATIDYIRKISCPLLVIHSPVDDFVSYEFGQRLFEAANEPKTFLEITGPHNNGFLQSGDIYFNGLDAFIGDVLGEENEKTGN